MECMSPENEKFDMKQIREFLEDYYLSEQNEEDTEDTDDV